MGNLRVLFIGGSRVISSACSQVAANSGIELLEQGACEIVEWYLADPARQVNDASLDAVMDKLAAAWTG